MREISKPHTINAIVRELLEVQEQQAGESITLKLLEKEKRQTDNALENMIRAIEQGVISRTTNSRIHELECK